MRRALIVLAAILVLLVAAGGTLAWLATRPAALAWAIDRAARSGGFAVAHEGLEGTLFTPVRAARVRLENDDLRIEVRGLRFAWRSLGSALLDRAVVVDELAAESVEVVQKRTSATRGAPPTTLALPIGVAAERITLDHLAVRVPGAGATFERLDLGYRYDRGAIEHRLAVRRATTPVGAASGELAIGGREPFAIRGIAALRDPTAEFPYQVDVALGGVLRQIGVGGAATVDFGVLRGSAVVQLYSAPLVDRILLAAENLDPRKVRRDWPEARLAVDVQGGLDDENRFRGTVRVRNALAGPIDRGRLPITDLVTQVVGDADGARLTDLLATDGPARLTGSGNLDRASVALALDVTGLDLGRIHSRLRPTRLSGRVATVVREDLQTAQGRLAEGAIALDFDAYNGREALELRAFRLSAGGGALEGRARAALRGAYPFSLEGRASAFDPAALGRFPQATLNGTFSASGTLAASPQAPRRIEARFDLAGSRWRGYTVAGAGEARVAGERIERADAHVDVAGNRIEVDGAYGAPGDVVRFDIAAPRLDALGLGVTGRLSATGTARGEWSRPDVDFTAQADTLAGSGVEIGTMEASAHLAFAETGQSAVQLTARRIRAGGIALARLAASAEGRPEKHRATIEASADPGGWFDALRAQIAGGLEGSAWAGTVESLATTGRAALTLEKPATVAIDAERVRVEGATVATLGGVVEIARFERRSGVIATDGRFGGVALANALRLADRLPDRWQSDLRLRGRWHVAGWYGPAPAAEIAIERESGDLSFARAVPPRRVTRASLGIRRLAAQATIDGNRLAVTADLAGDPVGTFAATVQTTLVRRGEALGIAGNAPLAGKLELALGTFALARPFLPETLTVDGAARGSLLLGGTVGTPAVRGEVTGERLRIALPDEGFRLRNGTAALRFIDDAVRIEQARFEGESGSVSVTGDLAWANGAPSGRLAVTLESLDAMSDPAFEFALSGAVTASVKDRAIAVSGKVRADRGVIRLPEFDRPTLSSDVVIRGRPREAVGGAGGELPETDLDLDLGERFFVRGRGVDARVTGTLNLKTGAHQPIRLAGVVRAGPGTVSAYGQTLSIERGTLTFTGPIDNPQLNVFAIRPNLPSKVGVQVTGFAQEPRITLYSDIAMTDSQRLAWLVLGRSPEGLGAADLTLLGTAAAALLGSPDSPPLTSRIAGWIGLDEISVRSSGGGSIDPQAAGTTPAGGTVAATGLDETIVSVGKRISDKLYISVERSLQTFTAVLRLRYQFNRRWSVQTQTGTVNTVDLFYTISFD